MSDLGVGGMVVGVAEDSKGTKSTNGKSKMINALQMPHTSLLDWVMYRLV